MFQHLISLWKGRLGLSILVGLTFWPIELGAQTWEMPTLCEKSGAPFLNHHSQRTNSTGVPNQGVPHAFYGGVSKATCLCSALPGCSGWQAGLASFIEKGGETISHAQRPAWLRGVSHAEYRAQHFRSVYGDMGHVLQLPIWRLQHALDFTARLPDVMSGWPVQLWQASESKLIIPLCWLRRIFPEEVSHQVNRMTLGCGSPGRAHTWLLPQESTSGWPFYL